MTANSASEPATATRKLATRLSSPTGASWTIWAPVIVFWCLNSSFLLASSFTQGNLLLAAAANVLPAGFLVAVILAWQGITSRLRRVPVFLPFVVGAMMGAGKGVTTYLSLWVLSGSTNPLPGFAENTVSAAFIGLWILPAMGVIGSILSDFENERELLVSETVSHLLESDTGRKLDENLAGFVQQARHQLTQSAHSASDLQKVLTDLAQSDARAVSHRLWDETGKRIGTFRLRDLLTATIVAHRFPATLSSASILLSLYASQAPLLGSAEALWRSFVFAAIVFIVFALGRFIPATGRLASAVVFFAIPALTTVAIHVVGQLFLQPHPTINTVSADLMIFVALTANALIFGAFFMARKTHEDIRRELQEISRNRVNSEADEVVRLIRRRETAELLHGYVQNQLLAAAARVGNEPESADSVARLIADMLDHLEQGSLLGGLGEPLSLADLTATTTELWRGVIEVEFVVSESGAWQPFELGLVDRIANELISNAHRHGKATHIRIDVNLSDEAISLSAQDNGVGPRNGTAGLGSALLMASTAGQWSRRATETGTGTLVQASLARHRQ